MNLVSLVIALVISVIVPQPRMIGEVVTQLPTPTTELHYLLNPTVEKPDAVEEKLLAVCSSSSAKTYMDYTKTSPTSRQGKFMAENMTIKDGLLYDKDGYIGVALGSYFGDIGSRYIFVLDTGIELKLIKVEQKSDRHTINGCEHYKDGSVIEFVIDMVTENFPRFSNSHPSNGNFNNLPQFKGSIVKIIDKRGE